MFQKIVACGKSCFDIWQIRSDVDPIKQISFTTQVMNILHLLPSIFSVENYDFKLSRELSTASISKMASSKPSGILFPNYP